LWVSMTIAIVAVTGPRLVRREVSAVT
jgi:hypothetical protein